MGAVMGVLSTLEEGAWADGGRGVTHAFPPSSPHADIRTPFEKVRGERVVSRLSRLSFSFSLSLCLITD